MAENTDSYSFQRAQAWRRYAPFLSGCPNAYVLVVSASQPSDEVRTALQKSFAALGYGTDSCTYFVATSEQLTPDDAFEAVEALDPGILIAADRPSQALIETAYRTAFPLLAKTQVFGRQARAFDSLESLMETPAGHQQIWAALKSLPRISR
ncbi:MAG: hypothetical protein ACOX1O_00350 [Eggerthellaceae bacterium]|jgi:hypothetical protein